MTPARTISAATARRFLAIRQLLAPPRSLPAAAASVMTVVEHLGSLQFDPLEVAGRNHDLVLAARIAGYRREWTDRLLYEERALYEAYNKGLNLLPTAELPWYRVSWDRARREHEGGAFDEHAPLVEELLDRIRLDGPLSAIDVEPRAAIDWYWRPTNQVRALLEALAEAGILGLRRRDGNRRVYDLAERLFPAELLAERRPERDQRRHKLLSRYRAHGLLGRSGTSELWSGTAPVRPQEDVVDPITRPALLHDLLEDGTLVPIHVEGVRGERYALGSELAALDQAEREVAADAPPAGRPPGVALLAPLDPYVWDRDFLRALHGFEYVWEVYVPAARRRWGYYVLPILYGDRLVGRIEPRIDRRAGTLRILDLWWEAGVDPLATDGLVEALTAALRAHRDFAGVRRITLPRAARHRGLTAAIRAYLADSPGPDARPHRRDSARR